MGATTGENISVHCAFHSPTYLIESDTWTATATLPIASSDLSAIVSEEPPKTRIRAVSVSTHRHREIRFAPLNAVARSYRFFFVTFADATRARARAKRKERKRANRAKNIRASFFIFGSSSPFQIRCRSAEKADSLDSIKAVEETQSTGERGKKRKKRSGEEWEVRGISF